MHVVAFAIHNTSEGMRCKLNPKSEILEEYRLHILSVILQHILNISDISLFSAVEEVDSLFLLQPTVIDGLENCGPSYTLDAVNEIDREVKNILMELYEDQND